ncbi:uncharacterized protein [Montipora capricornis]|uniref:uncharacterized protein isoform X1 n=1 Tax=Montipora capricornis TaxID=246305 RepID=UPI0035F135FB
MNCSPRDITGIYNLHHKAKCCLVLRRFKEATEICGEALEQSEIEERHCTPFVVVAVQAYAEINQWKKAVEFAYKAFGDPQNFSPAVMELCICLLSKASEFGEAGEMAEKWLSCEKNFLHQKYLRITELYINCVLVPQGLHRKIETFLEGNKVLTSQQKQLLTFCWLLCDLNKHCVAYLVLITWYQHDHLTAFGLLVVLLQNQQKSFFFVLQEYSSRQVKADSCEDTAAQCNAKEKQGSTTVRRKTLLASVGFSIVITRMLAVYRNLERRFRLNLSIEHRKKFITILRVLILLFFIYALVHAASWSDHGMASGSGISVLWQAVLTAWRAMFYPYHLT